jgi:histidine triad (HIT) family protein
MAYDPDNIFARILRDELPCAKICEDANTLAFMDIMPSAEGHALVVPRESAETIFELSPDAASALILTTQKVAKAVQAALACPGIVLVQLNGAAAGQSIPHVHFHVVPRWQGLDLKLHGRERADGKTLETLAARIRAAL